MCNANFTGVPTRSWSCNFCKIDKSLPSVSSHRFRHKRALCLLISCPVDQPWYNKYWGTPPPSYKECQNELRSRLILVETKLQARFRETKTTTQAHHYQIIWLLAYGKTTAEVMAVTGYSRGWIYEASLGIQPFRTWIPRSEALQKYRLWPSGEWCGRSDGCGKSYSSHPPMAGCGMVVKWPTGWVNSRVKKSVVCIGWEYLKSMKYRLRVPRPEPQESDIRRTGGMEKKICADSSWKSRRRTQKAT